MTKKKTAKKNPAHLSKTVTCLHCRYEYAAGQKHCPICGHPWPWAEGGKGKP